MWLWDSMIPCLTDSLFQSSFNDWLSGFIDSLSCWSIDSMNGWFSDSFIQWLIEFSFMDSLPFGSIGFRLAGFIGSLIHVFADSVIVWSTDSSGQWRNAWFTESLIGSLIYWFIHPLHGLADSSIHWIIGSLLNSFVDSWDQWFLMFHWFSAFLIHWLVGSWSD